MHLQSSFLTALLVFLLLTLCLSDSAVSAQATITTATISITSLRSTPTSTTKSSPSPINSCLDCLSTSVRSTPACAAIKDFNPSTFSDLASLNTTAAKACFCALSSSQIWLTSCTGPDLCPAIFVSAIEQAYNITRNSLCSAVPVIQGTKNGGYQRSDELNKNFLLVQAVSSFVALSFVHAFF